MSVEQKTQSFSKLRCKMVCQSKTAREYEGVWQGETITLSAVWEGTAADGQAACEENKLFSKATPSATFNIYVESKAAADFYVVGRCYYLDSTDAGERQNYCEGWALDSETGKYRDPDTGELKTFMEGPGKVQEARNLREHQARLAAEREGDLEVGAGRELIDSDEVRSKV